MNAQPQISGLYASDITEEVPMDLEGRRRLAMEIEVLMKILTAIGAKPELWNGRTVVCG